MSTTDLKLLVLAAIVHAAWLPGPAGAQGTFRNLDFESAQVAPVPAGQGGGYVPITDALPGWVGFIGTNQLAQVLHNNYTLAVANISIIGPRWSDPTDIPQGFYVVFLESGTDPFGSQPVPAFIRQTGLVPANAKSLQFTLAMPSSGLSVSLGGHALSYFPLSKTTYSTVYGADVSPYAGQTGVLEFRVAPDAFAFHIARLDAIQFSPSLIPEPDAFGLLLVGLAALALQRPRRRQARLG